MQRKMKVWKKVALAIPLVLVLLIGVIYYTQSAVAVVRQEVKAISRLKYDRAYSLTSADFKAAATRAEFEGYVVNYSVLRDNKKIEVLAENDQDGKRVVRTSLTARGGEKLFAEFKLVREDHRWRIYSLNIEQDGDAAANIGRNKIDSVLVSDVMSIDGRAAEHKETIESPTNAILVTVDISDAAIGTTFSCRLAYADSNKEFASQTRQIHGDGNIWTTFEFEMPVGGWEKGRYHVDLLTSNGQSKTVEFNIQ